MTILLRVIGLETSCLSAALYLLSIEGGRKNDLRHKE